MLKTIYKYFTGKTAAFINKIKSDDLLAIYEGI
jgi:hypothetical protein